MSASISTIRSGIDGLDTLLNGGLVRGRMYLVQGEPGTGKTLLGMHFLEAGLGEGETVLCIHGEESQEEIVSNGLAVGIDVSDAEFLDLGPESDFFTQDEAYDLVHPSDLEQEQYTRDVHDAIKEIDPTRVVLDPITQLRYVESSGYQFRKRMLAFMRFLKQRDITVVATAPTAYDEKSDAEVRSLSDGIIELTRGVDGRRITPAKHRALGQMEGEHGLEIRQNGIEVYPDVVPVHEETTFDPTPLRSGVGELDDLLEGGFEQRTVTFISGPSGVGKTTLGTQFMVQAIEEGMTCAAYLFEEGLETYCHRTRSIGFPIDELRESGTLTIEQVEPLTLSNEEFAHRIIEQVETQGTDVVFIDGIDGYTISVQGEESELIRKLHGLTRYLKNEGVTVIFTNEISEITGISTATSPNISYLADNLTFMSYVELDGRLRKVIGVLKKRTGGFEHSLREFEITDDGIRVGDPLSGLHGVLQGNPRMSDIRDLAQDE
ncbi:ATPase domain-containing protein [Natronosalvus caseinilyticus]|uniref:ATPase domain-containing protein n=1 Tax=Natronosalvus caseinilyticus TaxID=2953747 RepID=UPI0028A8350A|nr:ATPase domain-containing protein [Natronosalvus caseinilyticus]